jgi:ferredoxin--NADP+ reductase
MKKQIAEDVNAKKEYNAVVTGKIMVTPDLMILRVSPDEPRPKFISGQYTNIGVMAKEPRSPNSIFAIDELKPDDMIIRPYSIASANHDTSNFEFYISQVKSGQLTPRLFNLQQGSRMWIDDDIFGIFNLHQTPKGCDIVMTATGTGLAPYISFLRSHLAEHKDIKMAVFHGAACSWDLGYYSELKFVESAFPNFFYFPTLLKPDPAWKGLTGYIETHLEAGILKDTGIEVEPDKTHFYLCGNPRMVDNMSRYLYARSYKKHSNLLNGSLHIEEY